MKTISENQAVKIATCSAISKSVITLIISFLAACNPTIGNEFYGHYSCNENFTFSEFTFYKNQTYSFFSSSCLANKSDSGVFSFKNDTLCFTSLLYEKDSIYEASGEYEFKTLTGEKFIYHQGKIFSISEHKLVEDTMTWIKDSNLQMR